METGKTYIAIDLKSFYASVECVERGLDPLNTNLVVADTSRTEKTICLAITPSLKAYGMGGRARLFEVIQKIKEINYQRKSATPYKSLTGKSVFDKELKAHPNWAVDYIAAPPRMALYIEYSTKIYNIYLKYISAEDIHVYSIDEVFIDATKYLKMYNKTAHELVRDIIRDVLRQTGITATAGIGTNLYLCKIAMDIVAKKIPADKDGVRIAELDEYSYRKILWNFQPLNKFWRIGNGIAKKLEYYGIKTMGQIARLSISNEDFFYKLFGVNAELLIDHAWGWEPCTIEVIKAYRPKSNSISSGQVLTCPYNYTKARIVIQEMADSLAFDLLEKNIITDQLVINIGYDTESLTDNSYQGEIMTDFYGRNVPKSAHGSINLNCETSSAKIIFNATTKLFDQIVDKNLLIRRLNITCNHISYEDEKKPQNPIQLELFKDYEKIKEEKEKEKQDLDKERKMRETMLRIKQKFGKNAILRGLNFKDGATAKERNNQIGGHKA